MICKNCGAVIDNDCSFCTVCGGKIEIEERHPIEVNADDQKISEQKERRVSKLLKTIALVLLGLFIVCSVLFLFTRYIYKGAEYQNEVMMAMPTSLFELTLPSQSSLTNINQAPKPGGKIVFTCQVDKTKNQDQICMINADGTGFRQLTNDLKHEYYYSSLSPDGQSIVFSSSRNGGFEIFEMDLNGRIRQLTSGLGELYAPEISPDGKYIVFTRHIDVRHQYISKMNRDGSNVVNLIDYIDCKDPSWSPDGSKIMFVSSQSGSPQIYLMNSDGSNIQRVTYMEGLRGRTDWSKDGRLASYRGQYENRNREIFLVDTGTTIVQITNGGDNLAPSFSPDGNWIAFTSYRDHFWDPDGCEIYIMRNDGSEVRRLTSNDYCDYQPRWGN